MSGDFGAGHRRPGTHRATIVVHLDSSWVTPDPAGPMPAGSTVPELQPGRAEGFSASRASRGDVGGPTTSRWVTGPQAAQENRRPWAWPPVARQFGHDGRRTTPGGTVTSVPIATQSRKAEPVSSGTGGATATGSAGLSPSLQSGGLRPTGTLRPTSPGRTPGRLRGTGGREPPARQRRATIPGLLRSDRSNESSSRCGHSFVDEGNSPPRRR